MVKVLANQNVDILDSCIVQNCIDIDKTADYLLGKLKDECDYVRIHSYYVHFDDGYCHFYIFMYHLQDDGYFDYKYERRDLQISLNELKEAGCYQYVLTF